MKQVGIEKEYAFVANLHGVTGYAALSDAFFKLFRQFEGPVAALLEWGWQIIPEYSKALIEVISPPYDFDDYPRLLTDLRSIETFLSELVTRLHTHTPFNRLTLSDSDSGKWDVFFDEHGFSIPKLELLLHNADDADYARKMACRYQTRLPIKLGNAEHALQRFAGFTSLNLTVSSSSWILGNEAWTLRYAAFQKDFWRLLNMASHHATPDETASARELLLDWLDPAGRELLSLARSAGEDQQQRCYNTLFGHGDPDDRVFKDIYAYAARPRLIGRQMMVEFRCFDSALSPSRMSAFLSDCKHAMP